MEKLLLVYPNQKWQKYDVNTTWNLNPATLCRLAAMVRDIVEIKIIDAQFYDLTEEQFFEKLVAFHPNYVGISVLSSEYGETLDITAGMAKKANQDIIVIAGGIHPTIEHEKVMLNADIDYLCRGEGEFVLKELILFLNSLKRKEEATLPSEGLVYRKNGRVVSQPQVFVKNESLKKLPWPDYNFVNLNDYAQVGPRHGPLRPPEFPYLRIMVTRGCPFGCSFCQVETISGRKIRTRDPLDVVNELLFYKDTYKIKSIIFDDDNIIADKKFFRCLLTAMIEKKLNLKFIIGAFAIFLLDDEILSLMIEAGCQGINIAIESGNKRVLKEIVLKPVNLDIVPTWIKKVHDKGLFCISNFIIGYPGETWDEIQDTIRYAETCGADYIKIFVAVPLKGTKLWDRALELEAFEGDPSGAKVEWRYSQIKSDEWSPRDISILRAYEWDRINFSTIEKRKRIAELWGLSEEEIKKIRKETRDALFF